MSPKQTWRLLKSAFQQWNADNASRLAAALAYYTVFSIAPLMILVIAIAGIFFDQSAAKDELLSQLQSLWGREGAQFLQSVLENANKPNDSSSWIASTTSVILLLVGASGVLAQLQTALNAVWNIEEKPNQGLWGLLRKRLLSFGMILGIGFLLLVSLVVSAVIAGFSNFFNGIVPGLDSVIQLLNFLVSFGMTSLLFAMIYKFLPDVRIAWHDVWFGAITTSILFTLGKFIIGLYLGNSGIGSSYGAAGSVIVFLAWVFYSAQILFFGAELTQVFAHRYGSRILPDRWTSQASQESQ